MALELHVWGPAFGLPSIEPECIATISFCQSFIPKGQWSLIVDHIASTGTIQSLPILFHDGVTTATGFEEIVAYLVEYALGIGNDPDANLTSRQRMDRTAFIAFLQSTATPLIDLLLYVSSENYNSTTSSAYTAILPWYANYTVPPKRRDLARERTGHLGLSSLDVNTSYDDRHAPGRGSTSSEYEAAKQAAGMSTGIQSSSLNMGRKQGIIGFLGGPVYAARFRLDTLSNELLEPISDLLGEHKYVFRGREPSSLDCLLFGYLSLLFYPAVPQPWLKETIQSKYPYIATYIHRLRQRLLHGEETKPSEAWATSTGGTRKRLGTLLPWRPRPLRLSSMILDGTREILGNVPGLSLLMQPGSITHPEGFEVPRQVPSSLPSSLLINAILGVTATIAIGLGALAIHHRRSPREGDLIFWALRPTKGLGEAGELLSVLANQLPS